MISDVPSFEEFDPKEVPWQYRALTEIENFDYDLGVHEVLFSGSIGSAKSLLMAHIIIKHCIRFPKAKACIGRLTMPDLRETILQTIIDHMEGSFVEGEDYELNQTKAKITFLNGSEIISRSWNDKKFKKFHSLKLSLGAIEELTENEKDYWKAYEALYSRIGRLPHVPQNLMISATNPEGPGHPAYERLILNGRQYR